MKVSLVVPICNPGTQEVERIRNLRSSLGSTEVEVSLAQTTTRETEIQSKREKYALIQTFLQSLKSAYNLLITIDSAACS